MPAPAPTKPAFAGLNLADSLKAFEVEDAPERRPKPDLEALAGVSARAGFPSREPKPAKLASSAVREVQFDERLTLRVTKADKTRFDDLAHRLRCANGEAFARILDAFEAQEAASERGGR